MASNSVKACHFCFAATCLAIGAACSGCGNRDSLVPAADGEARPIIDPRTCARPPNGCGPGGFLGPLIPECPVPPACFSDACSEHDLCYRLCGIDRAVCDNALLLGMRASCTDSFAEDDPQRLRCNNIAFIYTAAVRGLGNGVFAFTQVLGCLCGDEPPATRSAQQKAPTQNFLLQKPYQDVDNDLLPDAWEIAVGLDPWDAADALDDPDGDGVNNLMEYVLDTDPFDSSSTSPNEQ